MKINDLKILTMKAKIHFGLIALALLGLSGCAKETTLDQVNPDTPIAFDTYLGRAAQTKGYVADLADLQNTGFGVYAFYTHTTPYETFQDGSKGADYMVNEKLTYSGGLWSYEPVKYWPNNTGDKVSFFAYAPYFDGTASDVNITSVAANSVNGDPVIAFSVAKDVSQQVDLLYAALPDQTKPNTSAKTTFNFKHALSRVAFKAQAVVDVVNPETDGTSPDDNMALGTIAEGTTITVNSIILTGNFNTAGKLNITDGKWVASSSSMAYTISGAQLAEKNVTVNPVQLNAVTDYMMLIPGVFNGVTVTVNYTVETVDDALASGKSSIENNITSQPFDITFEQGKAYSFVLHLGLNSVKLSAEVSGWGDETTIVTNVPLN